MKHLNNNFIYLVIFGSSGPSLLWGFSLVLSSEGYSLVEVCRLLLLQSVGSRAHRLQELWLPVLEHKLNSCGTSSA